jgi:5-methylcytosine-specific restriction enzyme A
MNHFSWKFWVEFRVLTGTLMPKRAKKQCRKPGCAALVSSGYCDKHRTERHNTLRDLDRKKTPEQVRFYTGWRWRMVSVRFRRENPLCDRCRERGTIQPAELVHHNPPYDELINRGLNPYSYDYLQSLCNRCHMEDLRAKRR